MNEQGAGMAELKEQMASMAKMIESMANMMQALANATTHTPSPIIGEGQVTQTTQADEAMIQTTEDAPTRIETGAAHEEVFQADPSIENSGWKKRVERLYVEIEALQGGAQKFVSNIDDLCVFPKVEVPRKFKIPDIVKFDGSTDPEHHLRAYCSTMGNWSRDENFLLAYFHTSLTGAAYTWYMKLDRATMSTWNSMVQAFQRHYSFNILEAPTRDVLMTMWKKNDETFREYAKRWRQMAMEVHPPLTDHEMKTYFIRTLGEPFKEKMIGSGVEDFAKLVLIGEWIEREYNSKGEESVNSIQEARSSEEMRDKNGKRKRGQDSHPFPDYGISRAELFKRLCEKGLMHPTSKPVKEYTSLARII